MAEWFGAASRSELGDPGRVHSEGRAARVSVEEAREKVASFLGTRPRQVIFTSGGTEAANAATWGALRACPGRPVLLAEVEHSCVRESSARLAAEAGVITVPVDSTGRIDPAVVEDALRSAENTPGLVQCQMANHEVGTLQPVSEIVGICRRHRVAVHVDACSAAGYVPLALDDLGADMVSVSAHKHGGPPGVGALVVRRGLRLEPFVVGGDQERARRAGFENVPAIVGWGAAAEVLSDPEVLRAEVARSRELVERLRTAATAVYDVELLGEPDPARRAPHILCVSLGGVEAEPVLLALDQAGIAAHSGSSCSSESLEPSPVIKAMGADPERSLRLSVGWSSDEDDMEAFARAFAPALERLRALRS